MHLILTGATGTVGAPILRHCLVSSQVTQLSILARRTFGLPKDLDTTKARIIVHEDYASYPSELLERLKGADGCIWAQGTSQYSVSEREYIRITYDFPLAAAKAFSALSDTGKFIFVHVSGKGAESGASLYGRTKARAENALLEIPNTPTYPKLRVFNVRPAYVDAPEYHTRPGIGRKLVYYGLAPLLRKWAPGQVTPTDLLSQVCVDLACGDGNPVKGADVMRNGRTLLPTAIRRLGSVSERI
ncbi:hypothetical protein K438DRAFT_2168237 [Mycena galopus ATCC 62051]|nr:hypothetical protein K438DRAFT_2168237 [Mycena galopus ATCC 62051]